MLICSKNKLNLRLVQDSYGIYHIFYSFAAFKLLKRIAIVFLQNAGSNKCQFILYTCIIRFYPFNISKSILHRFFSFSFILHFQSHKIPCPGFFQINDVAAVFYNPVIAAQVPQCFTISITSATTALAVGACPLPGRKTSLLQLHLLSQQ